MRYCAADGNGVRLCDRLKAGEETATIPVVLMLVIVDPQFLSFNCADEFISKPFETDELLNKIELQLPV